MALATGVRISCSVAITVETDVAMISPRTVPRKEIFKHDRISWINEITTQAKSKL